MKTQSDAPLFIAERQAMELVDMATAIEAMREAFAAQARGNMINAPRLRTRMRQRALNVTAAEDCVSGRSAIKAYGGGTHHILLYGQDKSLLAVIESAWLGQLRTGAATGLATELMARPDARKVGLIGAGRQARTQALALRSVGRLAALKVFARDRAKLEDFCVRAESELKAPVTAAASAHEAVVDADIVVTATTSSRPVVMDAWIAAGTHLNGVGANAASRLELDPEILARADVVAVDDVEQAKGEAGELIQLVSEARMKWTDVLSLDRLLDGNAPARRPDAVTVFKSLGVGLEDLAIACVLYDRASQRS